MLILNNLTLTNFISHENSAVKFKKNQKLLISGNSGSGKSSIIDAIVFILYNQGRVDSRNLIQRKKKFAKVELTLDDDGKLYKIIRTITDKGKHELTVLEGNNIKSLVPVKANGTRGIQEYLEKNILHSSYLLFINSIVYPQNNTESFVNQTAARKKEIILEMINAGSYDEYYEKIKNKITDLQNDIYMSTTLLDSLKTQMAEDALKAEKLDAYKTEQTIFENTLAELKKEEETLTAQIQEMNSVSIKIEMKNQEANNINKEILACEDVIKGCEIKIEKAKNADAEIASFKEGIKDIDKTKKELAELIAVKDKDIEWSKKMMFLLTTKKPIARNFERDIEELNRQLIRSMSQKFELCPEVQKACPILTKSRDEEVKRLEKDLSEKTTEMKEYVKMVDVYNLEVAQLGEKPVVDNDKIKIWTDMVEGMMTWEKKIIELEQNRNNWLDDSSNLIFINKNTVEQLKKSLLTVWLEIKVLNDHLGDKVALQASLEGVKSQYMVTEGAIRENSTRIMVADMAVENMKKLQVRLEELAGKNKESEEGIENLKLLKEAFGQNGIKAILIDYVIPKLEDSINEILSKLSDFRVKLDTQKSGVGEDVIKEGLFIEIYNELGEKFDFDAFSGGEKVKISAAIFEALASIQNFGFRVLDESIISLDEDSTEKFVEVMESLQQTVNQIICISHIRQIKELYQDKITINKINGISKII